MPNNFGGDQNDPEYNPEKRKRPTGLVHKKYHEEVVANKDEKLKQAIQTLHMVYHERDFRVRVNDPTINFVRRQLTLLVGGSGENGKCPACAAGYNYLDLQPNDEDRR